MRGATHDGIDAERVSQWLEAHVAGARRPFTFEQIAGGHSNLTYRVDGSDRRPLVLRRPPMSHTLASAHDMGREYRIIAGLGGSAVPVPPALAYCDDTSVNGAPFYVMGFVDGNVVRDVSGAEQMLDQPARARASESLVDTLVAIHEVDLVAAGLDTLGRHEGYIERQLKRWYGQWNQQKTRELPAIDEVYHALLRRVPEQGPATIVHGDYRLDNCIVTSSGDVAAVLDWEICTLGDPLADLGLLLVYWTGPGDASNGWASRATTAPGFFDRAAIADRYAARSGRDLGQLPFYTAFAHWKLACIMQGVYARYLGGALGARDASEIDPYVQQIDEAAARAVEGLASL